jgi:multidrug resistance efflux pump
MLKRIVPLAAVGLVFLAALFYSQRRGGPLKVSGFVETDEIRIGSRVGGRVKSVLVEEGDNVAPGQTLVELEPFQLIEQQSQYRAQLAEAQADFDRFTAGYQPEEIEQSQARLDQLSAARDRLANGEEDIAAAQASLDLAEAQLELAKLRYNRTESLFAKNSAAQADMDQVNSELRVARATVRVRVEELAKLKRTRPSDIKEAQARVEEARQEWLLRKAGYRQEDRTRAQAAVAAARAALAAIDRQIEELTIRAPAEGTVNAVDLRPGDLVGVNTAAISIVEKGRLWMRAYVPESHLDVRVGRNVTVTIDSFPKRSFKAHVTYVSQKAEFTPGNVQTPEDRSKQVFRIKVMFDKGQDLLRSGMMGDVLFDVDN